MELKMVILIGWSLMNWALMIICLEAEKNPRRNKVLNIALGFFIGESVPLGFITTTVPFHPYEIDSIVNHTIFISFIWACLIVKYGEKIVRHIAI